MILLNGYFVALMIIVNRSWNIESYDKTKNENKFCIEFNKSGSIINKNLENRFPKLTVVSISN